MTCSRIDIISLFPQMFSALDYGITGRDACREQLTLKHWNPRDYTNNKHGRVDDRPFGGGPGMLLQIEPLSGALEAAKTDSQIKPLVIMMSPDGQPLTHKVLTQLKDKPRLIIVAGRYEGIDQRFIDHHVDVCYSTGDFVVSGGELPAMMLIDGLSRLLPGVLGHQESASEDSFAQGLLDHPHYTRPAEHKLGNVPEVLINGDHRAIAQWRRKQAIIKTWQQRPDMIENVVLTQKEKNLLSEHMANKNKHSTANKKD